MSFGQVSAVSLRGCTGSSSCILVAASIWATDEKNARLFMFKVQGSSGCWCATSGHFQTYRERVPQNNPVKPQLLYPSLGVRM